MYLRYRISEPSTVDMVNISKYPIIFTRFHTCQGISEPSTVWEADWMWYENKLRVTYYNLKEFLIEYV